MEPSEKDLSGNMEELTRVFLVLGNYFDVEGAVYKAFVELQNDNTTSPLILVFDGPHWKTCPLVQLFQMKNPSVLTLFPPTQDHPASLINAALPLVKTQFVTFLWPGNPLPCPAHPVGVAKLKTNDRVSMTVTSYFPDYPLYELCTHGHFQCHPCFSGYGAVFRTDALRRIGGADPNPIFQKASFWDLFLRISRENDVCWVNAPRPKVELEWTEYPFIKPLPFEADLVHRCMVKNSRLKVQGDVRTPYLYGLSPSHTDTVRPYFDHIGFQIENHQQRKPINITVTGGPWEPAHNQLCFFNYFETDAGKKLFHWKPVFDYLVTPEKELEGTDLLIISRGRCPNIRKILNWCDKHSVPTLYMIDDNWFTVAKDWPVYKDMFSEGKPDYEMFLEALRRCTAVVVYNPLLKDYVSKYARKIYQKQININLDLFVPYWPSESSRQNEFIVGYSGSPRYTETAFGALAEFISTHSDVKLLYFGPQPPKVLTELLASGRGIQLPYMSYSAYSRAIAAIKPDVLLAPVDDCVTSRSKCFNKYLEITACGAIGVYSAYPPYTGVVEHGRNGLLIQPEFNDKPAAWLDALNSLHADRSKLLSMKQNAFEHVRSTFHTTARYPDFVNMINELTEQRKF